VRLESAIAAAKAGIISAQFEVGGCYECGYGVAKDAEQAVAWYHRAAEAGHAIAQYNLGLSFSKGAGVAKDASRQQRGTAVQQRQATQMLSSH